MAITTEEREIIRELLDLAVTKTPHMLPEVMSNPVSNYNDPAQLDREINVLFRNFPIALAHTSELAEPGSFVTHDDTGVPLLVTRTHDGEVKAFLNVCRHRGARVEDEPCGKARAFTCPYHAWTYGLDGQLRGMPQPVGFESVDRSERGLVEVPAFERLGLVWVVPSAREKQPDIDAWLAPMDHVSQLDLGSHVVFEKWSLHRNMNWRIAAEGFMESYHFCSAHRETACSNYVDNLNIHLKKGPHFRHAVPVPRVLEMGDEPEEGWEYRRNFMDQNYMFPANFIQVMTDHVYVHTILPTGPGTCVFQCTMLIPEAAETDKAKRYWQANYNVVRAVFDEDFKIGEGIQKGYDSGANQDVIFGRYEAGLHLGQQAIDDALAGKIVI